MRAIALLIVPVYFLLTAGIHIQLHHCCGKLVKAGVIELEHCAHHDEAHSHGAECAHKCCTTTDLEFKIDSDQWRSGNIWINVLQALPVPQTGIAAIASLPEFKVPAIRCDDSSPPVRQILRMQCRFVFYG